MTEDDESYREFLFNEPELNELAYIFMQIPWKYEQGYLAGKEYLPLKDFLEMNNFDLKTCIPLLIEMSNIWAEEVNKRNSKD